MMLVNVAGQAETPALKTVPGLRRYAVKNVVFNGWLLHHIFVRR